jgi:hypothetical protein
LGATYQTCSNLSLEECFDCQHGTGDCSIDQNVLQCYLDTTVECASQSECQTAGTCSDSQYLTNLDANSSPMHFGACVISRTKALVESTYEGFLVLPFCLVGQEDFPNGCVDLTINKSSCQLEVGTWWSPSLSQETCTLTKGCLDVAMDIGTVGVQYAFSPKSTSDCALEGTGSWESYFTWNKAQWVPGTTRKLSWIQRKTFTRNQYGTTLDFAAVQDAFFSGEEVQV